MLRINYQKEINWKCVSYLGVGTNANGKEENVLYSVLGYESWVDGDDYSTISNEYGVFIRCMGTSMYVREMNSVFLISTYPSKWDNFEINPHWQI